MSFNFMTKFQDNVKYAQYYFHHRTIATSTNDEWYNKEKFLHEDLESTGDSTISNKQITIYCKHLHVSCLFARSIACLENSKS